MRDLFNDILLRQHKAGGLFAAILPYSNPLNRNRNMINKKRIYQLINYIELIKPSSWYYNQFPRCSRVFILSTKRGLPEIHISVLLP